MKKVVTVMMVLSLLASVSYAQFTAGTKSVSSIFSYTSEKEDKDQDDPLTTLQVNPTGSYFVIDNVSVDIIIDYTKLAMGDDDMTTTNFGFGGSYYMPMEPGAVYGGLGFLMTSMKYSDDDDALKANNIQIKAGYLYGLVENWYFDIGLRYNKGIGKWKYGSDEGDDNTSSTMWFGVGIATFF